MYGSEKPLVHLELSRLLWHYGWNACFASVDEKVALAEVGS
jgi:hypothetical protein